MRPCSWPPEGRFSTTGKLGRFRAAFDRLTPHAERLYLIPTAQDALRGRRLSLLFRILPVERDADLAHRLAAERPITVTHLLASWLAQQSQPFTASDAVRGVEALRTALPRSAFVDPELTQAPEKTTAEALRSSLRLGVLSFQDGRYALAAQRRHPRFPDVPDIVAFFAAQFEQTRAALTPE